MSESTSAVYRLQVAPAVGPLSADTRPAHSVGGIGLCKRLGLPQSNALRLSTIVWAAPADTTVADLAELLQDTGSAPVFGGDDGGRALADLMGTAS